MVFILRVAVKIENGDDGDLIRVEKMLPQLTYKYELNGRSLV